MKSLKSAILTTPKWAVVDISDFNYTKLQYDAYIIDLNEFYQFLRLIWLYDDLT